MMEEKLEGNFQEVWIKLNDDMEYMAIVKIGINPWAIPEDTDKKPKYGGRRK